MSVSVVAVLDKINAGRLALGALPLADIARGRRSQGDSCPIANSLRDAAGPGVDVGGSAVRGLPRTRAYSYAKAVGGIVTSINGVATVTNPPEFSQFVQDFDAGHFSQYESV